MAPGALTTISYEVHALRYATLTTRRANLILGCADDDSPMQIDYFIWLIRGGGKCWVVDTGFKSTVAERRGRNWLCCPTALLGQLGVNASDVEDVIITHLHYDHAGNLDRFDRARFHVQEREMRFATGPLMSYRQPSLALAMEQNDIVEMVKAVFDQRVMQHDGDVELAPGLWLHRVPGHTPGTQCVRVHTQRGWVVLASDASHFYCCLRDGKPFHLFVDLAELQAGWGRLQSLASSIDHIIPGHDPETMRIYPPSAPGLDGRAVRLDCSPLQI